MKYRLTDGLVASLVMIEWQQGRFSACGLITDRVEDHDHFTGLVRLHRRPIYGPAGPPGTGAAPLLTAIGT